MSLSNVTYYLALTKVISSPHQLRNSLQALFSYSGSLMNLLSYLFILLSSIEHTEPELSFWTPWDPSLSFTRTCMYMISLLFEALALVLTETFDNACPQAYWDPKWSWWLLSCCYPGVCLTPAYILLLILVLNLPRAVVFSSVFLQYTWSIVMEASVPQLLLLIL